ncbi:Uncharacterised protein [Achromobacter sp. 2789STDY5608633]|uniref:DUF6012 family protein n=1 Tax=Achromobacter sp. 2789STDY5608633 TaxID=1806501 RepID=UPI0006C0A452|nr:DUF6012 family protein [Achromobacter sp. 2789STDY5608633]CUJ69606.1 Uncharacterised protein [Achromobacter sp. 2789STDY5608633]
MLIHVIPRILLARAPVAHCSLIDFRCVELDLVLREGTDLTVGRPYPNKTYLVARRRVGRRAVDGLLIETPDHLPEFTTVTRWAVNGDRVLTHEVQHILLDQDHDAATENMVLWYASGHGNREFPRRWPEHVNYGPPVSTQPLMDLRPSERHGTYEDTVDGSGWLTKRRETFYMHTIERDRIDILGRAWSSDRTPTLDTALRLLECSATGQETARQNIKIPSSA